LFGVEHFGVEQVYVAAELLEGILACGLYLFALGFGRNIPIYDTLGGDAEFGMGCLNAEIVLVISKKISFGGYVLWFWFDVELEVDEFLVCIGAGFEYAQIVAGVYDALVFV
jgi:hypothetical protein